VIRAGIHPDGIPQMFEILLAERTRNPGALDAWFATHPGEEERVTETRAAIAQINPAVLRTLTRDSQNYQNFKRRVQSLPPSPTTR
jgi:beta-barrel assembly-enhancing protease